MKLKGRKHTGPLWQMGTRESKLSGITQLCSPWLWGQTVFSFPDSLHLLCSLLSSLAFLLPLASVQSTVPLEYVSFQDCLAVNGDDSQSQILRRENVIIPAMVRCLLDVPQSAQLRPRQQNCMITWPCEVHRLGRLAYCGVCFIGLGKEAAGFLSVSPGWPVAPFSLFSRQNGVVWYFPAENTTFSEKLLVYVQCISNAYFLWENCPIFSKLYIEEHLHQIFFLFRLHILCIYSVTSSSGDCDYICDYSAASC